MSYPINTCPRTGTGSKPSWVFRALAGRNIVAMTVAGYFLEVKTPMGWELGRG